MSLKTVTEKTTEKELRVKLLSTETPLQVCEGRTKEGRYIRCEDFVKLVSFKPGVKEQGNELTGYTMSAVRIWQTLESQRCYYAVIIKPLTLPLRLAPCPYATL